MKVETNTNSRNTRMENYGSVEEEGHMALKHIEDEDERGNGSEDEDEEGDASGSSGFFLDERSDAIPRPQKTPFWLNCFNKTKNFFIFIFHVDQEVWDSPNVSRKQKIAVIFWLAAFSIGYALERASFKILVDHAGPFRMFAAEAISGLTAIALGATILFQAIIDKSFQCKYVGFPLADIGVMAILDTIQLLLCVISGSKIPPIFVVLLVQMVTPLTMTLTTCFGSDVVAGRNSSPTFEHNNYRYQTQVESPTRAYTARQVLGASLITMAVIVGLFPAIIEIYDPYSSWTSYNSGCNMFIFLLSCVPAALSTLYKEYTLAEYKLPVSTQYLNFVLAIFQVIFTGIISPLVYPLQGFAQDSNWTELYPSSGISDNFMDSIKCFIGTINQDIAESEYAEPAECNFIWILLVGYVLSVMISGVAVDKIIKGGAYNVLYRGLSVGVILAVWLMWYYDANYSDKSFGDTNNYVSVVNSLHLLSVIVLIFGLDVYHRDPLSETSFETVYQLVGDYSD